MTGDDLKLLTTDRPADNIFDALVVFCIVLPPEDTFSFLATVYTTTVHASVFHAQWHMPSFQWQNSLSFALVFTGTSVLLSEGEPELHSLCQPRGLFLLGGRRLLLRPESIWPKKRENSDHETCFKWKELARQR